MKIITNKNKNEKIDSDDAAAVDGNSILCSAATDIGQITDRDTKEAIEQVTIQLLKSDSTYVAGAISNENGLFHVTAPANGKYLLKISSVGYKSTMKRIQIFDNKDRLWVRLCWVLRLSC